MALGVLLVIVPALAAGCGTESPGPDVADTTAPPAAPSVVGIFHATAAGGTSGPAVDVSEPGTLDPVVAPLRGSLAAEVTDAATDVVIPSGQRLWAGVVTIDCAAPERLQVVSSGAGYAFRPVWTTKPPQECFAPVTTVALVLIGEGWSGGQAG